MRFWVLPLAAWGALLQGVSQSSAPDATLESWVRDLDGGQEPAWTQALDGLSALGEAAVERVLRDFEATDFTARRARAKLLLQVPAPASSARVLELLSDPDPQVRRLLADWLGNPALARVAADERIDALERLSRTDPSDRVRNRAREALTECALEEAVPALDRAIEDMPPGEAESAAEALTRLPAARERLIQRLVASFEEGGPSMPEGVRAALLRGYGRALAEVPGGGESQRERLPLLLGRTHFSEAVQSAARTAFASFVARAAELSESERAERVLARLADEGWPRVECLQRRLALAWVERGDPEAALSLARELGLAVQALGESEAEGWDLRARLFEGAALYALARKAEATALFDSLTLRIEAGLSRRADLYPSPSAAHFTEGGGSAHIDRLHLAALVRLWRALLALDGQEGVRVLEELRRAHILFLQSRLVSLRTDAPDPSTLDSLLQRDLSPYTLVLFNEKLEPEGRVAALDRSLALALAWGQVAPLEMQGLSGAPPSERILGDLFYDADRRHLLLAMRAAHIREIERNLERLRTARRRFPGEGDPVAEQDRELLLENFKRLLRARADEEIEELKDLAEERGVQGRADQVYGALSTDELRTVYARLLDYLQPSMHAHTLAGELRSEGRSSEARQLCERALATLRTAPLGSSLWSELSSARFELLRGSTLMDDGQPDEAEGAYLAAEQRLLAIEAQLNERRDALGDPSQTEQLDAYLRQIREMRGEALLSLAVNANVRLRNPVLALEYFERAYFLNQSPFMRVLRACYRARSGLADEARTVLASVVPVPSLYYNIACTHALLGDKELALDYLERDFRENHSSAGSLAQKREWARKDPDLAALGDEGRFLRLLGGR